MISHWGKVAGTPPDNLINIKQSKGLIMETEKQLINFKLPSTLQNCKF